MYSHRCKIPDGFCFTVKYSFSCFLKYSFQAYKIKGTSPHDGVYGTHHRNFLYTHLFCWLALFKFLNYKYTEIYKKSGCAVSVSNCSWSCLVVLKLYSMGGMPSGTSTRRIQTPEAGRAALKRKWSVDIQTGDCRYAHSCTRFHVSIQRLQTAIEAQDTVHCSARSLPLRMVVHCVKRKAECLRCSIMRTNLNELILYAFLSTILNQYIIFALSAATASY